jgi:large subunit ribosomal protein L1
VKKGKVEFRVDKQGGVHLSVGKVSFSEAAIMENATCVINALQESKPGTVKGKFITNLSVAPSMNPGLKLEI